MFKRVLFKRFIPLKREKQNGTNFETRVKGTGCFESEYKNEGLFHEWGSRYEEGEENFGNETIGIIELTDGTIEEVLPRNIKFVK